MKLVALTPIEHNGKAVAQGEDFDADKKAAIALLAGGHASEAPKAKAPQQPGADGDGVPSTDVTDPAQP